MPHLHHPAWGEALLLFAALVLVPLLLDLVADASDAPRAIWLLQAVRRWHFPAALFLGLAYAFQPGVIAALCAAPWACMLLLLAATGSQRVLRRGLLPVSLLCRDMGLMYAAVAALWLLADRLALRPLGFDGSIVLLTAVHFHYAGLLLPVLAAFALEELTPRGGSWIGVGVIAGVPAVAVGITSAQLRLGGEIETTAALIMASSGLGVAILHLQLARRTRWPGGVRGLFIVAGGSLAAGMTLAALYGVRVFFHPWPWLDLPWMRALHGSLNALGFGLGGVLAWWQVRKMNNAQMNAAVRPARITPMKDIESAHGAPSVPP